MKHLWILSVMMLVLFSGCEEQCPAPVAPEIISLEAYPEVHSARMVSDLKSAPWGMVECGFYIGKDKITLERIEGALEGASIVLDLEGLSAETTYYYKSFISNGKNEIGSGFDTFTTEPDPENVDPGPGPGPGPEPGPDPDPFPAGIESISASVDCLTAVLNATISGDASRITSAAFWFGTDKSRMQSYAAVRNGSKFSLEIRDLEYSTTYYYRIVISNGSMTKESGTASFTTEDAPAKEPDPEPFTAEIESVTVDSGPYQTIISVRLGGNVSQVKKAAIMFGVSEDKMKETVCTVQDGMYYSIFYGLEPGSTYCYYALISDGTTEKRTMTSTMTVPEESSADSLRGGF